MSPGGLDGFLERLRAGLLALVDTAVSDEELGSVGAGPMENSLGYAGSHLRWVEQQCTASLRFGRAAAAMWIFGRWPHDAA